MRHDPWVEWILMPVGEAKDDHDHDRDEYEDFQAGGDLADHLDAAHVNPGEQDNKRQRNQVVLPPGHVREVISEVVREQHRVRTTKQKRGRPVPPAGEESPEVAESGAGPAVEAALDGHGGGEFGRHQGDGNTPEDREDEQVEKRDSRAGGGDHVFEAEGASRGVGEHYEDEVEETGFAEGGLGGQKDQATHLSHKTQQGWGSLEFEGVDFRLKDLRWGSYMPDGKSATGNF